MSAGLLNVHCVVWVFSLFLWAVYFFKKWGKRNQFLSILKQIVHSWTGTNKGGQSLLWFKINKSLALIHYTHTCHLMYCYPGKKKNSLWSHLIHHVIGSWPLSYILCLLCVTPLSAPPHLSPSDSETQLFGWSDLFIFFFLDTLYSLRNRRPLQ